MPLIQVKLLEGVLDAGQKRELIARLTDAAVSVEGEALRGVTWVTLEEVSSGAWGIGGQALTTEMVRAMAAAPAEAPA